MIFENITFYILNLLPWHLFKKLKKILNASFLKIVRFIVTKQLYRLFLMRYNQDLDKLHNFNRLISTFY